MWNAVCSKTHVEVLLPVLQVYSTWNLFHSMFTSRWIYVPFHKYINMESNFWLHPEMIGRMWQCHKRGDGLRVPPSGCYLENDFMHKQDRT
jgi:hypothetical protein